MTVYDPMEDTPSKKSDRFAKKGLEIQIPIFKWKVDWEYLPGKALKAIKNLFKKEK